MNKNIIKSYLWKNKYGKNIPIQTMDDDYLFNCYRRCMEIIFGDEYLDISTSTRIIYKIDSPLSKEKAIEWKERFEEEYKRRGKKIPKFDKNTYYVELGKRVMIRQMRYRKNKEFDNKF